MSIYIIFHTFIHIKTSNIFYIPIHTYISKISPFFNQAKIIKFISIKILITPKQIFTLTISTVFYTPNKIKISIISNMSISRIIGRLIPSHNRSYIASIIHIIINRTIWSIITTTSGFIIPNTKCCNICPFSWAFPP